MRELKRSIARAHLEAKGAKGINRRRYLIGGKSIFARYWRYYFVYDPNDEAKNERNKKLLKQIENGIRAKIRADAA